MFDSHEDKDGKDKKGDEDMVKIKDKLVGKHKEKISRQDLRKKLIRETINENRTALEKLSRT